MKAVVMAGGEGTRLRPVSQNIPKPMAPLLDRPALGYILELLRRSGIDEACLTLKYLPEVITDYIGDGSEFNMKLHPVIEGEALGTAGSVKNCAGILGGDDFLVISGDCVCDFDLKALVGFHKARGADVTLALYSHPEPLEYGLVVTDSEGRIESFVEKPAWEGVVTDKINTGIYVISPSVLSEIPDGRSCDFGKEVFPRLLREGRALYGFAPGGYWRDIGSCEAYLDCCMDILDGRVMLGANISPRVPDGVVVTQPVYIGDGARIAPGAIIGPRAVIGAGSVIEAGASVTDSVINGAAIREGAELEGAVICKNAVIGRATEVWEGAVVGEGCAVGDGCLVAQGVKLWPERSVPDGTRVTESITRGMMKKETEFTSGGVIEGSAGDEITPGLSLALGSAAAAYGRVGLACSGGEASRVLADAFGSGVCAAGGELMRLDCGALSCVSFAGMCYGLPLTVCITEVDGTVSVTFFGKDGGPPTRDDERRLISLMREGARMDARGISAARDIGGVFEAYAAAAARYAAARFGEGAIQVRVTGGGYPNRALRRALMLLGGTPDGKTPGLPSFEASADGLSLTAADEDGRAYDSERLYLLAADIELRAGRRELAAKPDAPGALDELAARYGVAVLRTGRDGEQARRLYTKLFSMRDAVFAAALICAYLTKNDITLRDAMGDMPAFASVTRELPIAGERAAVMSALSCGCDAKVSDGVCMTARGGRAYISPLRRRQALLIRAEAASEEIAEELCAELTQRVMELDTKP